MQKIKKIKRFLTKYGAFYIALFMLLVFALTRRGFAQGLETQSPNQAEPPTFPYETTFVLTGYYSPLPDQDRFVTGSYEADVRLNGEGVHSADGTIVYMGMIAAPKNFPFGTKIEIPGLGIGTVHDRGGAIKGNRLDIWMGYGQDGMDRALAFGMPAAVGTVYGVAPDIKETLDFSHLKLARNSGIYAKTRFFKRDLGIGDESTEVLELQRLLRELGYFDGESAAFFGTQTMKAVLKFQLDRKIVKSEEDRGAGVFGPRTRVAFERLLDEKNLLPRSENLVPQKVAPVSALVVQKSKIASPSPSAGPLVAPPPPIFAGELTRGDRGADVEKLQRELYRLNFLRIPPTGFFGEVTQHAVFKFQQAISIVKTKSDSGAGYVGPKTREALSRIIAKRDEQSRLIAEATEKQKTILAETQRAKELLAADRPADFSPSLLSFQRLSYGTRNEEVRTLQKILKTLGYFPGHLTSDYFGEVTRRALAEFQIKSGLVASEKDPDAGVYDKKTAEALAKLFQG